MQTNESLSQTIEPDAIDAYVHQLLTCYAFTPCDRKLQVFAVQDIIPDKMSLKVNHLSDLYYYCIVSTALFSASHVSLHPPIWP